MTTATVAVSAGLRSRSLPAWGVGAIALGAAALAVVLFTMLKLLGGGPVLTAVGGVILFLAGLATVSTLIEGGRAARNRVATALLYSAFILAVVHLVPHAFPPLR